MGAVRPLSLLEVNIMLAIDERLIRGEPCRSNADLDLQSTKAFEYKIRNICGLFLNIIDSKVYLLHQSAKEFLISQAGANRPTRSDDHSSAFWKHSLKPVGSHLMLTRICLVYLLLRELDTEIGLRHPFNDQLNPFLIYAAVNWPTHFRESGKSGQIH